MNETNRIFNRAMEHGGIQNILDWLHTLPTDQVNLYSRLKFMHSEEKADEIFNWAERFVLIGWDTWEAIAHAEYILT